MEGTESESQAEKILDKEAKYERPEVRSRANSWEEKERESLSSTSWWGGREERDLSSKATARA